MGEGKSLKWLLWSVGSLFLFGSEQSMEAIERSEKEFLNQLVTLRESEIAKEKKHKRHFASIAGFMKNGASAIDDDSRNGTSLHTPRLYENRYDARLYISLKNIEESPRNFTYDAKSYISLKQVILPTAENYAKSYLSLKSLENPVRHRVEIKIDKHSQTMYVLVDGIELYRWKVSTARRGYITPGGRYRPYSLERMHYSRKYHNSPMPWSIFFKGGYAIHGTYSIRQLGRPASHGCVRLHPKNAKTLYSIIRKHGMRNTRITID